MNLIEHFINGKNFSGNSSQKGKVFNPATGEQTAEVKLANKKDVKDAVENVLGPSWARFGCSRASLGGSFGAFAASRWQL